MKSRFLKGCLNQATMFKNTYFIAGIILCICIIAIVVGIRILRETRNIHDKDMQESED